MISIELVLRIGVLQSLILASGVLLLLLSVLARNYNYPLATIYSDSDIRLHILLLDDFTALLPPQID